MLVDLSPILFSFRSVFARELLRLEVFLDTQFNTQFSCV